MERHLGDGAVSETELVVRLERDLEDLDDAQSGLALIKSWASQGWLHRIVDERHDQNVCYLTQDARRALDFLRGMRRQDTIATGGSITGIASRLKQVAVKVDNDPARIRKHIDAEITALHEELDQLDAGQRPQPDVTDCYDEARAVALQMERLITDIGQYGTMIEQATAALGEPIDSNTEYRDRQRQMYTDYQAAWDSQGRDSHRAFLRMINDPDQRAEFEVDVAAVAEALPALDPALRKVMAGFFGLVGHQIDEVERIQQRCAQRVKRFTAFGTMEQSRGIARQLNEAIGATRALLKSSFTDSRSANPPTMGAVAATSCIPRVVSCAAPTNAAVHPAVANAMAIRSRGASRSAGGESPNVNAAMMKLATRSRRRSRTAVATRTPPRTPRRTGQPVPRRRHLVPTSAAVMVELAVSTCQAKPRRISGSTSTAASVLICRLSIDACPHHRF
jgi:hypothetical protein